jgi:hypothetical protein
MNYYYDGLHWLKKSSENIEVALPWSFYPISINISEALSKSTFALKHDIGSAHLREAYFLLAILYSSPFQDG